MSTASRDREAPAPVSVDRAAVTLFGVGLGGSALLLAMPPGAGAWYPPCPFLALTGMDCPFCGGLRSTHALLTGDVAASFDHNILIPFLALALAAAAAWWAIRRIGGPVFLRWSVRTRRVAWSATVLGLAVFWVVRNIPALEYLDSGLVG